MMLILFFNSSHVLRCHGQRCLIFLDLLQWMWRARLAAWCCGRLLPSWCGCNETVKIWTSAPKNEHVAKRFTQYDSANWINDFIKVRKRFFNACSRHIWLMSRAGLAVMGVCPYLYIQKIVPASHRISVPNNESDSDFCPSITRNIQRKCYAEPRELNMPAVIHAA